MDASPRGDKIRKAMKRLITADTQLYGSGAFLPAASR